MELLLPRRLDEGFGAGLAGRSGARSVQSATPSDQGCGDSSVGVDGEHRSSRGRILVRPPSMITRRPILGTYSRVIATRFPLGGEEFRQRWASWAGQRTLPPAKAELIPRTVRLDRAGTAPP